MRVQHLAIGLLLVCLTAVQAQTTGSNTPPSVRRDLVLGIEWVRSPRAVLNVNPPSRLSKEERATYAAPIEMEPRPHDDQDSKEWSLQPSDKYVSLALLRWAQQAGWQMVWEAERDFVIESSLHLSGDFLNAVGAVMLSLADTDYPLQARANSATLTLRINRYRDAGRH